MSVNKSKVGGNFVSNYRVVRPRPPLLCNYSYLDALSAFLHGDQLYVKISETRAMNIENFIEQAFKSDVEVTPANVTVRYTTTK